MGQVVACVGKRAEKPYKIEYAGVRVFSVEELCFFLWENMYLLDRDIMNQELINWIYEDCVLPELATKLQGLMRLKGSLHAFVASIWEAAYYKAPEVLKDAESKIRESESLSVFQRRKRRADYLLEEKRYLLAIEQYKEIYRQLENQDDDLKARVLHNMGVVHSRLFYFDAAADCFMQAYEYNGKQEELKHFLGCKRMSLSKAEYVDFTAANKEYYQVAMELEKEMEQIQRRWDMGAEKQQLQKLKQLKEENDKSEYYRQLNELSAEWKKEYEQLV